jgi:hypothetical protein
MYTIHKYSENDNLTITLKNVRKYWQIISIDPGVDGFAIRIEKRNYDGIIETLVWQIVNCLTTEEKKTGIRVPGRFIDPTGYLNQYFTYYDNCHMVVIEKQLLINTQSVNMSKKIIDYFVAIFKKRPKDLQPVIYEVNPRIKSCMMDKYFKLNIKNYKNMKTRDINYCRHLLDIRNDKIGFEILQTYNKTHHDDMANILIQIEALFDLLKLPLTPYVLS